MPVPVVGIHPLQEKHSKSKSKSKSRSRYSCFTTLLARSSCCRPNTSLCRLASPSYCIPLSLTGTFQFQFQLQLAVSCPIGTESLETFHSIPPQSRDLVISPCCYFSQPTNDSTRLSLSLIYITCTGSEPVRPCRPYARLSPISVSSTYHTPPRLSTDQRLSIPRASFTLAPSILFLHLSSLASVPN